MRKPKIRNQKLEITPSLFGFIKPTLKVPISEARIREAKAAYAKGDIQSGEAAMREVRYKLEDFLKRINTGPHHANLPR